jgi:hypothetical protein
MTKVESRTQEIVFRVANLELGGKVRICSL